MKYKQVQDISENNICDLCGKPFNSEYHLSDECVNLNEDCLKELDKITNKIDKINKSLKGGLK